MVVVWCVIVEFVGLLVAQMRLGLHDLRIYLLRGLHGHGTPPTQRPRLWTSHLSPMRPIGRECVDNLHRFVQV